MLSPQPPPSSSPQDRRPPTPNRHEIDAMIVSILYRLALGRKGGILAVAEEREQEQKRAEHKNFLVNDEIRSQTSTHAASATPRSTLSFQALFAEMAKTHRLRSISVVLRGKERAQRRGRQQEKKRRYSGRACSWADVMCRFQLLCPLSPPLVLPFRPLPLAPPLQNKTYQCRRGPEWRRGRRRRSAWW